MRIVAPSILSADFGNLERDIKMIDRSAAEWVHIDVMDGKFVPSISYGMPVIKSIRPCTERVFDVHLMIEDPDRYIDEFVKVGADIIVVHAEACRHLDRTIEAIKEDRHDMIFTNLVDFDMLYGHRNNIQGFGEALEYFDSKLPEIIENMGEEDILIITADHGNDPSTPSTDHSREYVPILVYGKNLKGNVDLGVRETYADIGQTLLDFFGLPNMENGKSFIEEIK